MYSRFQTSLRNNDIKRDKDKKTPSLIFTYLCAILLIVLGVLFYVQQNIQMVRIGYNREKLKQEKTALFKKNKELKLEKASLESLSRIELQAKERLNMVEPNNTQIIYIKDDK